MARIVARRKGGESKNPALFGNRTYLLCASWRIQSVTDLPVTEFRGQSATLEMRVGFGSSIVVPTNQIQIGMQPKFRGFPHSRNFSSTKLAGPNPMIKSCWSCKHIRQEKGPWSDCVSRGRPSVSPVPLISWQLWKQRYAGKVSTRAGVFVS